MWKKIVTSHCSRMHKLVKSILEMYLIINRKLCKIYISLDGEFHVQDLIIKWVVIRTMQTDKSNILIVFAPLLTLSFCNLIVHNQPTINSYFLLFQNLNTSRIPTAASPIDVHHFWPWALKWSLNWSPASLFTYYPILI